MRDAPHLAAVDRQPETTAPAGPASVAKCDPAPTQQQRMADPLNVECARAVNAWLNRQPQGAKGMLAAKLGVGERTLESWLYLAKPWPFTLALRTLRHCPEADGSLAALNEVLAVLDVTGARPAGGGPNLGSLKVKLAKAQHTIAEAEADGFVDHVERRAIRADLREVVAEAGGYLGEGPA